MAINKLSAKLAAAIAGVGLLISAPMAHADPASNNDQYDQYLISLGVPGDLLQLGYQQCAQLRAGTSEKVLIGQLETPGYNLGRAGAEDVVTAAHQYLCADA
jgi:hypothetical protein